MRTFDINIPKGCYISWLVLTQAANKMHVKLENSNGAKTYFDGIRQSTVANPPLSQGFGLTTDRVLKLTIECLSNPNANLKGSLHSSNITNDSGSVVGVEFNLNLEDWIDNDYNDVTVSITAWTKAG